MKELSVCLSPADFGKASEFIEGELERSRISKQIIQENIFVFEAVFNDILLKGYPEDTKLDITIKHSFGNPEIKLGFPGTRYVPQKGKDLSDSVEYRIISTYEDKLEYAYHSMYNTIRLIVKRGYLKALVLSSAAFLVAMAVYLILLKTTDVQFRSSFLNSFVNPVENLFTNAMLMIGTPMTFFSLLKNLLETYIVSERSSAARKLKPKTIETSVFSVILAIVCGLAVSRFFPYIRGLFGNPEFSLTAKADINEVISSIVPAGIFEPFSMISPFPLIFISVLISFALRSAGSHFDRLKSAVDSCYMLFSRMLNLVMFFLPTFCFLAFLDILLRRGVESLKGPVFCWVSVLCGTIILFLFYAAKLKFSGVRVIQFIKSIIPVLRENIKINSSIDAVPYNVRQCSRLFGADRNYLEDSLKVLAQTNLDGNCFIIMHITMLILISAGIQIPWWSIALLAVIVVFLSYGAPNQPGSILIGLVIIFNYLDVPSLMPAAIFCEVLFGVIQNLINVTGDIVIVASQQKMFRKETGKNASE